MFYAGKRSSPTEVQTTLYNDADDVQSMAEPGRSEPGKATGDDALLESVYSCDSLLDEIDDADYEDDDEPFDLKTKQYLDARCRELKLPLGDPIQQYAELKVADVLSRGTLSARKQKKKLDLLRKTLPPHKIITSDYSEALDLLNDVNSHFNKDEKPISKADIFNKIITLVKNNLNENTVQWVHDCEPSESNPDKIHGGNTDIVDVRQLAMDLVSSSSDEDEDETKEEDSSEDEPIDFTRLDNIDFLFPRKEEERLFTPSFEGSNTSSKIPAFKQNMNRTPVRLASSSREKRKMIGQRGSSSREHVINKKCSNILDPEDMKISKKKMIIIYKELIVKKLQYYVLIMHEDKELMKHELFRNWNARQIDGLEKMKLDVSRRKMRLAHRLQRVQKKYQICKSKSGKEVNREIKGPVIVPEINDTKNKRWKRTIECIREREKLLMEKQGCHFLSGFLGNKANIRTEGVTTKEWPEIPTNLGVPPGPPRTSRKISKIFGEFMESEQPTITYGDLLRILEGDTSLIMNSELGEERGDTTILKEVSNTEHAGHPTCREWDELIRKDNDIESPFLTKRELRNYLKMLNEKFFPDPNFKLAQQLVSIDENALISDEPDVLKLNYSLKELEKDSYQAENCDCAQSRGIYFFQYKPEYSPIDIQTAYEQYVNENVGFEEAPHKHPSGCLLIYANVKLVVVMIEGQVDHLFYHFASFRNSQIHKFIEIGRVLNVSERVSCILDQWVSIVTQPPPGEMTYFTNSKKILHRVAESRVHHFKRKLHDLYSFLSKTVNKKSECQDKECEAMPSNMKSQLNSCQCQQTELADEKHECNSALKIKSLRDMPQYQTSQTDEGESELDLHTQELLPSPALVGYLLQYRKLKTIDKFLDEFVMQPVIESEDEKYNVVEDTVISHFVDCDQEEDKIRLIKEIKRENKEHEILIKCQQDLIRNYDKEQAGEGIAPWAQSFDTSMFIPKLVNVQVRKKGEASDETINVDPLIDSNEEPDVARDEEQYILWNHQNEKLSSQRQFLNFLDTGAGSWQKKVKRFGITGRQAKQMLREAHRYKQLRKILQIQDKMKNMQQEAEEEEEEGEADGDLEEGEQGGDDEEDPKESKVSILQDTTEEIEELLNELDGEGYELLGEEKEWPYLTGFEGLGELPERFGEGFNRDFPGIEWVGERDQPQSSRVAQQSEFVHSETGESYTEGTSVIAGEEAKIPDAPPATSVTDTSTDP